jgi:hypothetical protein
MHLWQAEQLKIEVCLRTLVDKRRAGREITDDYGKGQAQPIEEEEDNPIG